MVGDNVTRHLRDTITTSDNLPENIDDIIESAPPRSPPDSPSPEDPVQATSRADSADEITGFDFSKNWSSHVSNSEVTCGAKQLGENTWKRNQLADGGGMFDSEATSTPDAAAAFDTDADDELPISRNSVESDYEPAKKLGEHCSAGVTQVKSVWEELRPVYCLIWGVGMLAILGFGFTLGIIIPGSFVILALVWTALIVKVGSADRLEEADASEFGLDETE